MTYSCNRHSQHPRHVWRQLLAEAQKLARREQEFAKNADLIESKYLQTISSMRPWENCSNQDLYFVWASYSLFQDKLGRKEVARELAKRLGQFSMLFKFDRECAWQNELVFDCFLKLCMFDEAIDYALRVEESLEQYLQENIEKDNDKVAVLIQGDEEISGPAIALHLEYIRRELKWWKGKLFDAKQLKLDSQRKVTVFESALSIVRQRTDQAVSKNKGMPIDSFEEQRLVEIERKISEALSRIESKNDEEEDDDAGEQEEEER